MYNSIPQSNSLDTQEIFHISNDFVKQFPLDDYGSLAGIISALGGRISYRNFIGNHHDDKTLEVINHRNFTIYIHISCSFYTFVWNLCHELGHFILHYLHQSQYEKSFSAYRIDSPEADKEADMFATVLIDSNNLSIMPKKKFIINTNNKESELIVA